MQTKSRPNFTVWSQPNCQGCTMAKQLIERSGYQYNELMIGINGVTKEDFFKAVPNARSVPQVFMDGKLIGGFNELKEALLDYTKTTKVV